MEETISKESQSPGYLVSEFTGVRSKKSQTISIKQYLDKVRSDEFKEKVLRHRLLRQQPGHEAEAQAIKSKMPCIIPAGICQGGHAASQLVQLSLITSVDLDDTNERTDEIFESLKELPYLKVLHRSISGTGLKAFLCISISNPDQYSAIYAAVSAEISQYAQHPCDKKCKDITRPCFYSWDPEAYYNPPPLTVCPKLQQQKKKEHRTSQSSTPFLPPLPVQHPQRGITLPLPDSLHSSSAISSIEIPSCVANEMTLH